MNTINAQGKPCPLPVIMAKNEIENGNECFEILVDDMVAVNNIAKLIKVKQFLMNYNEIENGYSVIITKDCDVACNALQPELQNTKINDWVLFVSKDTLGSGDDELGTTLIQMFFYTLTQTDDLPSEIIFMNGGVKLPVFDEQIVKHLTELQKMGCKIIVCGTCLNFFEIAPKLKIGDVSNMYEITELLQKTKKVISL